MASCPVVLSFRGATTDKWNVSVLFVRDHGAPQATVESDVNGVTWSVRQIAEIPLHNPKMTVYRCDVAAPRTAGVVRLSIDGSPVTFAVPDPGESPRIAYGACNGFSDPKAMKSVASKNDRWEHLLQQHALGAYHLLLLGGDQVYADEIWKSNGPLYEWTELSKKKRLEKAWTKRLRDEVDKFYCKLYLTRWVQPPVYNALTSIPTVVMWDDHDIFDGWGSYEEDLHQCPVYQGVFEIARSYFRIFQQQLADGETHPAAIPEQSAFNMGFAGLGKIALLVLDLRSERHPDLRNATPPKPAQVIALETANAIYKWLDGTSGHKHLLVMSSIPVAYLDLGFLERMLSALPGQQELEDDLRDHWRSESHLQERKRLIHRLLRHATDKNDPRRVTILSGDVHLAAAGLIEAERAEYTGSGRVIHQLISSAIVHPAPPALARYVLEQISDRVEEVEPGITASMQLMGSKGGRLIGQRNWLALEPDQDDALWANWHIEGMVSAITKVIHPAIAE